MTEAIGVIFATTGKNYTELAERAAHTVKEHCPGLEVDLFTDQPLQMPVFDRIHQIEDPWRRSKIDAMAASRFYKTLYLDADLFVIADIRDIFDVLDRFDMAMAHDDGRNTEHCHVFWRKPLPNAFPQFNSGVIALRKEPEVIALLKKWSATVRRHQLQQDQAVLREFLWDSNLRIATLPCEYNLMRFRFLRLWNKNIFAAPRILHSPRLHEHFTGKKRRIHNLSDLLGPIIASRLTFMRSADRGLARMAGIETGSPTKKMKWSRRLRLLRDVPRHWLRSLR